jgi:hypothetical protein
VYIIAAGAAAAGASAAAAAAAGLAGQVEKQLGQRAGRLVDLVLLQAQVRYLHTAPNIIMFRVYSAHAKHQQH